MSNPFEKKKDLKPEAVIPTPEKPVAQENKPTEAVPVQPEKKEMTNFVIHSEVDAMLLDRIKSQPQTLDEIDKEVVVQPREGRHQLSLPVELDEFTKKYCFTWIFKRKQAIDEACDIYHYKFTNRTFFPLLPDHLFSARGVMERGDMVLMFRPRHIDEEMRKAPGLESLQRIKTKETAHEGNPKFYIPKPEEKEEGRIVGV